MNSTRQPVPLSAFGARPPASTRRRTPKSHSPCASRRSLRILPTFNLQLSTLNRLFPRRSLFLFSYTYELPILQPLCFDIHASDGGCRGCIAVFSSNLEPPTSNLCLSSLFRTLLLFFAFFCTCAKLNSFIFKRFRTLCEKYPGVRVRCFFRALRASRRLRQIVNQTPDERLRPEVRTRRCRPEETALHRRGNWERV
jgi:hypothetical protein